MVRGRQTAERIRHAIICWREARRLGLEFDAIESPDWMAEGLIFALVSKRGLGFPIAGFLCNIVGLGVATAWWFLIPIMNAAGLKTV